LIDEAAGQPLELAARELPGIDLNSPLGAAERHADHRRLPGHQARERAHLVEVYVRMKAKPALERPTRVVVLNAVADVIPDRTVVELDHDFDAQLPARRDEQGAIALRQLQELERLVEEVIGRLIRVHRHTPPRCSGREALLAPR
jgi:hypothetical protein